MKVLFERKVGASIIQEVLLTDSKAFEIEKWYHKNKELFHRFYRYKGDVKGLNYFMGMKSYYFL